MTLAWSDFKVPSSLLPTGTMGAPPRDEPRSTIAWMFAALNTVEPPIFEREMATEMERDESWYEERLPRIDERIRDRLSRLSDRLGNADWLYGSFNAGDLLMIEVLRRLEGALLDEFPNLDAYVVRGQARPAFKRAFAAQREVFEGRNSRPNHGPAEG